MRILIFGGGGFVGLNIAEAALAAGHTVTLAVRGFRPSAPRGAWSITRMFGTRSRSSIAATDSPP